MEMTKEKILSYNNFNSLTRDIIALASEIMPDKIIYINFLNDDVQVTMKVSKHDTKVNLVEGTTIPVDEAICNNIDFENGAPLILENASNNSFNDKINKTIKDGNIGSYLGIPILFRNGKRFGALCAAHHNNSKFDKNDIYLLERIANLFSYYLELESHVYVDLLTGLGNTRYLLLKEEEIINQGGLALMLDLDSFKLVNDTLGHHIGDLVLKEFGLKVINFIKNFKTAYAIRLGGDEFLIYIKDELPLEDIKKTLKSLNLELSKWSTNINNLNLTSSIGAFKFNQKDFNEFSELYKKIDSLLYKAKNNNKGTYMFETTK
ncbi:MAG: diguanylate cyclase [Acholeplasmataceae bacterium]